MFIILKMKLKILNLCFRQIPKIVFIKENCKFYNSYSTKPPYNALFFGSDAIALNSLRKVNELRKTEKIINRLDLVTANSSKHKSTIEKFAQSEDINLLTWSDLNLKESYYDIGLIVAFGHLIKEAVLDKFPLGMVNVHPSLLPRWRGAAPIIHTLLHGDEVAGVSLMKIKPNKFDVGEIVSQKVVSVSEDILLPELTQQLSDIGAEMLVDCLRCLPSSLDNAQPQSVHNITYAKKINKNISAVRWSDMTAREVYNLYRAIYDLYPLTTTFRNKQMKLFNAFLYNDEINEVKPSGSLDYCMKMDAIRIVCKDNRYIYFKSLRIVGKRKISALDFYNGYIKNVAIDKRKYILCC